jgi:Arc/MetJ family transcription regulator
MKRTNVVFDDKIVDECMKVTGIKTRNALRELLRHENQKKILQLKGKVHWEGNLVEWRQDRSA